MTIIWRAKTGPTPTRRGAGRQAWLSSLVRGDYRLALRARLQRRPGAALLERPLRTLAAATPARAHRARAGHPQ